jgi:dimethylglycine catabolism B
MPDRREEGPVGRFEHETATVEIHDLRPRVGAAGHVEPHVRAAGHLRLRHRRHGAHRRHPGAESLEWCYGCGKCVPVCPVDIVGEYGPRKIHRKVQTGMDLFNDHDLWLCTTCMNCLRVCPKEVDMIQIMPAVREKAVADGNVPAELQEVFEKTFKYGNAWGEPQQSARVDQGRRRPGQGPASDPSPVDVLFYVEDYWSYHPRGHEAAQACARIFIALGDRLGDPRSRGEDHRRLPAARRGEGPVRGADGGRRRHPRASTSSAHRHPRPARVQRVGQGLSRVRPPVRRPALHPAARPARRPLEWERELSYRVTFHDPCYLGPPQRRVRRPGCCCKPSRVSTWWRCSDARRTGTAAAGGGGAMWLDSFTGNHTVERLSERRVKEAAEYGADVLAVCCPYEVSRFEDAAKSTGNDHLLVRTSSSSSTRPWGMGSTAGKPEGMALPSDTLASSTSAPSRLSGRRRPGTRRLRRVGEGAPPTLSFVRPAAAYVSIGYHRRSARSIWRHAGRALPVIRRMIGGGPVYLDAAAALLPDHPTAGVRRGRGPEGHATAPRARRAGVPRRGIVARASSEDGDIVRRGSEGLRHRRRADRVAAVAVGT